MFVINHSYSCIMAGRNGGVERLAGWFSDTGIPAPIRLATLFGIRERVSKELIRETETMATTKPRFKSIDIDWIIPRNTNTPSGKILLTRNERKTFKLMFKENHLLWAGCQPVRGRVL